MQRAGLQSRLNGLSKLKSSSGNTTFLTQFHNRLCSRLMMRTSTGPPGRDPLYVQFLQVETIKQGVVVSERKPL